MIRLRFGLAVLLLAFACRDSVKRVPATEILLRLHADADVRADLKKLRVSLAVPGATAGTWTERDTQTLDVPERDGPWPVDIPITPHDPSKLPSQVEIVVDGLDAGGDALLQERAITSFVAEQQRTLELTLARCGSHPLGTLCEAQPGCHGTSCQRCDAGTCSDTHVTSGDSLPLITVDVKPDMPQAPDAGESAGAGGRDAAAGGGGGASGRGDGGSKAAAGGGGTMDAGSGGNAGAGGAGGSATETWSPPELLETSDVSVTAADAWRNVAGDMVVVWRQDSSDGPFWARRYVNGKWDADSFNFYGVSPSANEFDVVAGIDRDGVAQILYTDGEPRTYWLRWQGEDHLDAAAPPLVLGDQTYGDPLMLGVTESGKSAAVWGAKADRSTQSQPLYANQFDVSTGWGTPLQIGSTGAQLLADGADINANGDWVSLFRVGNGSGSNMVESFVSRGSTITTPTAFDMPDALAGAFLVSVNADGNALALYLAGPDLQHLRFHWSHLGAADSSWSSALALTPEGTANGMLTLADKTRVLVSMEGATSGGAVHLVAYRFDEGAGWSAGERISDDFTSTDQDLFVTANAAGAVIVAWSETSTPGTTTLAYKRFASGKGWGDKGTIASCSGSATLTTVSLNADGRAIAVWSQDQPAVNAFDLKWSRSP